VLIALRHLVLAQARACVLRVGHRFDPARIHRLQLLDQPEYRLQLGEEALGCLRCSLEARELGDAAYIV